MNPKSFKDSKTTRGFTYHYYFSPAHDRKQFIVFLHGFPSSAGDWHFQVTFFQAKGYGIIAPDLLGYGGTSKPLEPALYAPKLIARDILDILDKEGITEKVIVVGHDWGTAPTNALAYYHPNRISAAVFISVAPGSTLPSGEEIPAFNEVTKGALGYELLGYWCFFSSPEAPKICEDNIDNFINILYADDPEIWKTDFAPLGSMKRRLLSRNILPAASWLPDADRKKIKKALLKGGLAAPMCWYRYRTMPRHHSRREVIRMTFRMPIYVATASKDYVCLAGPGNESVPQICLNTKSVLQEYNTGHWVQNEAADEFNSNLLTWIEGL